MGNLPVFSLINWYTACLSRWRSPAPSCKISRSIRMFLIPFRSLAVSLLSESGYALCCNLSFPSLKRFFQCCRLFLFIRSLSAASRTIFIFYASLNSPDFKVNTIFFLLYFILSKVRCVILPHGSKNNTAYFFSNFFKPF